MDLLKMNWALFLALFGQLRFDLMTFSNCNSVKIKRFGFFTFFTFFLISEMDDKNINQDSGTRTSLKNVSN